MILILITYLAGVLTILSPCILPVLPFVFSRAQNSFVKSGLPLLAGMALTFSIFSAFAIIGGEWVIQANNVGRWLAMVLLSFFGLTLIFPELAEKLLSPLTRMGSKIGSNSKGDSIGGSFLIGISTGLLWAPCAGPILGLVLTGAAAQGNTGTSIGLLIAYSLGAATSLAIALVSGNKFLGTLKKFLGVDQVVKKVLGVAVILGVVAIAFNLDRTLLTQLSKFETNSFETKLLALAHSETSPPAAEQGAVEGVMPELADATIWLNSKPLTKADLLGKVVLVDFWTYSCINCLRSLPYVKAWAEKYKNEDLVVIGVHAPEFAFEKNLENVKNAVKDLGLNYPIAVDNEYKIWNAFHNEYWPAHYFIDRQGRIRHHHFGEGEYAESEKILRELLTEGGVKLHETETQVQAHGVQTSALTKEVASPETYVGYGRAQRFVGTPALQKQITTYKSPASFQLNEWSLSGKWQAEAERSVLKAAHGQIQFRFHARDLHLVLGAAQKVKFKITIDGHTPGEDHGMDTDSEGHGVVEAQRLYQLIRQKNETSITDHTFEIEFESSDVEAYAFTFG